MCVGNDFGSTTLVANTIVSTTKPLLHLIVPAYCVLCNTPRKPGFMSNQLKKARKSYLANQASQNAVKHSCQSYN